MEKKNSTLKGLLLGAIAGLTAGVLFAPKSGKETREDIKNKALELTGKARDLYTKAETELKEKVTALKETGASIDKKAYGKLVDEVVDEVKKDGEVAKETASKMASMLKDDWKKIVEAVKA